MKSKEGHPPHLHAHGFKRNGGEVGRGEQAAVTLNRAAREAHPRGKPESN